MTIPLSGDNVVLAIRLLGSAVLFLPGLVLGWLPLVWAMLAFLLPYLAWLKKLWLGLRKLARPLPLPRKPRPPRAGLPPRPPGLLRPRPLTKALSAGEEFILSLCFLKGDDALLGDPGCVKENFGPLSNLSILLTIGVSLKSVNYLWFGFSESCIATFIMCSLPVWNTMPSQLLLQIPSSRS